MRRPEDAGRHVQTVPDLRPEPLRGIPVPALGDVRRAHLRGCLGYPGRLAPARVVLPQPALGVEVAPPPSGERDGAVAPVDRDRARAGRVDPDPHDSPRGETRGPPGGGQGAPDAPLQRGEVVARMLAREVGVPGGEEDALAPAPVGHDAAAELRAVGAAHDEGARGIGSEVDAEGERHGIGCAGPDLSCAAAYTILY